MSAVGIRLVGGPADGMEIVIPGDPWDPPRTYEIMHALPRDGLRRLTYGRELNPGDDGPLWHYRHLDEPAA